VISTIEPSEIRETEAAMPVLMRFEKGYLEKHAPGQHNQQNHAGGRSVGGGKSNYTNLMDFVNEEVPGGFPASRYLDVQMKQTYSQNTDPKYNEYFKTYITDEGLTLNRKLRTEEKLNITETNTLNGISAAMKDTPNITESITVYRGIKKNTDSSSVFNQIKEGDTFEDSGFASTSLSSYVAAQMANVNGSIDKQGIVMKINVPAGSEGVYPNSFLKGFNPYGQEVEFLLPQNSKFKVNAQLGKVWEVEVVNG
jgi:hypothetical protein